ncbi:hypothetical protein OTB20_17075 [Streptomyces sp. H27-H1]|uniref:hypothetical protein n=1 Tax=Streptomyces sp. H27-H1 TaxID=2996461 RepID=UPI0022711D82|nr:hypothetical protein [Streptomyces sp. H27-H1]MCY0927896.1 hypothetical protein [Streptomyces sp. H27-H1]
MALASRIRVSRNSRGEPDYTAPAGGIAVGTMWVALVGTAYFVLESQLLSDHRTTAYTVISAVTVAATFTVFFAAKAVFRRFGAHWWHIALATALLCCAGAAAPKAAAYVFPDQMARYHRELGGPGHCLHATPYGSEREFPKSSQITYDEPGSGRMTVTPIDKAYQPLVLDHAVRGGLERLTAADAKSIQILKSYGC